VSTHRRCSWISQYGFDRQAITDLTQYDFEILDSGEPRKIQNFSPVKTPYHSFSPGLQRKRAGSFDVAGDFIATICGSAAAWDRGIAVFGTDIQSLLILMPSKTFQHRTPHVPWNKFLRRPDGREKLRGVSDGVARLSSAMEGLGRRPQGSHRRQDQCASGASEDVANSRSLEGARELGPPFALLRWTRPQSDRLHGGPLPDLRQFRAGLVKMAAETGGNVTYPKEARTSAFL
jgi:hypothetical protein